MIHFAHAYSSLDGDVSRGDRTQHALIRMGPSILAAAFTTICSATVMIFTVITFFQKFAIILFFTILMATVGSFVVFITLTDCVGPARPTYLMDRLCAKMIKCCRRNKEDEELDRAVPSNVAESVVDGRRTSLYTDLESMSQSMKSMAASSSVVEGRRESLYSDLDRMKQSTKGGESFRASGAESVVDGRRSSLYSDLESF